MNRDTKLQRHYFERIRRRESMHGVFSELLFTYSPPLEEALGILVLYFFGRSETFNVPHFKYGLPTSKHRSIHFVMKPKFWKSSTYQVGYDDIWTSLGDREATMKNLAHDYDFRDTTSNHHLQKYRRPPRNIHVFGWSKFHLKVEAPIRFEDVDCIILPIEILQVARENERLRDMFQTLQTSPFIHGHVNNLMGKLYVVKKHDDAQEVYMNRLVEHNLFNM